MEYLLLAKHLLGTYIGICFTVKEILVSRRNIAALFAAQIDSSLPPSPKENLSHLVSYIWTIVFLLSCLVQDPPGIRLGRRAITPSTTTTLKWSETAQ